MGMEAERELAERKRHEGKGKQQHADIKTAGTDQIQSYARDMPDILSTARHFWFTTLIYALRDPANVDLAVQCMLGIHYTEGIMSRYLAKADVFWAEDYQGDYDALYATRGGGRADEPGMGVEPE